MGKDRFWAEHTSCAVTHRTAQSGIFGGTRAQGHCGQRWEVRWHEAVESLVSQLKLAPFPVGQESDGKFQAHETSISER